MSSIPGFSKLDATEKLERLLNEGILSAETKNLLVDFMPKDPLTARLFEKMTENVISAFPLPYSVAPGFLINGRVFAVPMVTEESSVVAAASWSARYWADRGGFKASVTAMTKIGQIFFVWPGQRDALKKASPLLFDRMRASISAQTRSMEARGGGITGFELIDLTDEIKDLFQIRISFNTADSMGANFINACLEGMEPALCTGTAELAGAPEPEVILSILSNYTPDCKVTCTIECEVDRLTGIRGASGPADFARRFELAVRIAQSDPYRAVTHNKGIYNGIDAVLVATANDFRAVEASGHAYAARSGKYTSLTTLSLDQDIFRYTLEVPLSLGTIGGLTRTHPLAATSFSILGNPDASGLMQIAASAGIANNFSAIKSLITTGIQSGHIPLHNRKSH